MSKQREDWHSYFMGIAHKVSTRATCPRSRVGAVFVRDRDILSTGYNGSIPGAPHCGDLPEEEHLLNGHCDVVIHAEDNAIIRAAKRGISLLGSDLYCTHFPCWPCAKKLISLGVVNIYYSNNYRPNPKVISECQRAKVNLHHVIPISLHEEKSLEMVVDLIQKKVPGYRGQCRKLLEELVGEISQMKSGQGERK